MIRYLDLDTVLKIHDAVAHGVVDDLGLIDGAVARPRLGFGGHEAHPSIWSKAAALLHGLASTQGFSDGNKRTGWAAALTFLELNGWEVERVSDVDGTVVGLAASIPKVDLDHIEQWFQQHSRRILQPADNVPDGLFQTPFGWYKGDPEAAPVVYCDGVFVQPGADGGTQTRIFGIRPSIDPGNVDSSGEAQEIELVGGFSIPSEAFLPAFGGILADMGVRIQETRPTMQFAPPAPRQDGPSRNRPCPCGSGKKYKKCHGAAPPAAVTT